MKLPKLQQLRYLVALYDTGHFALEEYGTEIAAEINDFLDRTTK